MGNHVVLYHLGILTQIYVTQPTIHLGITTDHVVPL
jgi:hypothetical protein